MKIVYGPGVNRRDEQQAWSICHELTGEEVGTLWTSPMTAAITMADPAHVAVRVGDPAMLAQYRASFDTRPMRVAGD